MSDDDAISHTAVTLAISLAQAMSLAEEVIGKFTEQGHPGQDCLRTSWIPVETVQKWRATFDEISTRDLR